MLTLKCIYKRQQIIKNGYLCAKPLVSRHFDNRHKNNLYIYIKKQPHDKIYLNDIADRLIFHKR
jgi:hypothetical protein